MVEMACWADTPDTQIMGGMPGYLIESSHKKRFLCDDPIRYLAYARDLRIGVSPRMPSPPSPQYQAMSNISHSFPTPAPRTRTHGVKYANSSRCPGTVEMVEMACGPDTPDTQDHGRYARISNWAVTPWQVPWRKHGQALAGSLGTSKVGTSKPAYSTSVVFPLRA
ncbi:hypothetical protein Syun_030796 [Stephania yunnanensis]|uniref:Uncharacterized protein n=1 Tax=Stephania yunnanensis TaxID=152371 RepID=A0AAP0DYG7_9MAGN